MLKPQNLIFCLVYRKLSLPLFTVFTCASQNGSNFWLEMIFAYHVAHSHILKILLYLLIFDAILIVVEVYT